MPLARIAKPHGLTGEVSVQVFTDFPERMAGSEVFVDGPGGDRLIRVETVRGLTGSRAILKLEGVADRDQAEKLRDSVLNVSRDRIPELPEGQYYDFQIVGLRVVTADGRDLGRITEVLRTGANDVYLTDQVLVPAVDRFIRSIDLERGAMVVEGLDELLGKDDKA